MPRLTDTSPEIERLLIDRFRAMSPAQRLERVVQLNRAVTTLSRAGIQQRHGRDIPEAEMRLRLAALRLDPHLMKTLFGWDPGVHGL